MPLPSSQNQGNNFSIPRSAVRSLVNQGEQEKWSTHRTTNSGKSVKSRKNRDRYLTDLNEDFEDLAQFSLFE